MYRIFIFIVFALAITFFARQESGVIVFETQAPQNIVTIVNPPPPPPSVVIENEEPVEPILPVEHRVAIVLPPPPPVAPPPPPHIPEGALYDNGLEATVNLICMQNNNFFSVATGAIIHKSGYIITNAHVAEGLQVPPRCLVRRGSPARRFDEAKLVFMPKAYAQAKTDTERARLDISIWKLEDSNNVKSIWEIDFVNSPKFGEDLLTQSYPAELASGELLNTDLNMLFSSTRVVNADEYLVETKGSLASQRGSSGGILIDRFTGKVRGIIFGIDSTDTRQINERILYALTPSAANETVQKETGKTLFEYLAGNP